MFEEVRVASARPPPFADDPYSGGNVVDVLAIFKVEIALSQKYGLHFDLGRCKLLLLVGEQFRGDVSEFHSLGVQIIIGSDLAILQTQVVGREELIAAYLRGRIRELQELSDAILAPEICRVPSLAIIFVLWTSAVVGPHFSTMPHCAFVGSPSNSATSLLRISPRQGTYGVTMGSGASSCQMGRPRIPQREERDWHANDASNGFVLLGL